MMVFIQVIQDPLEVRAFFCVAEFVQFVLNDAVEVRKRGLRHVCRTSRHS